MCPQITQITQMVSRETKARGEIPAVVGQRPGTGGQGNDSECKHSSPFPSPPACARGERRPRHSSSSDDEWRAPFFPNRNGAGGTDALRTRRPVGRPATTNARVWSRRAFHRWAAIFRSPTVPPSILGPAASRRLSAVICVICGPIAMGGWVAFVSLCLRVCDVFLCVSLCVLCASVVHRAGGWASCRFPDTPAGTTHRTPLPVRVGRAEFGR